MNTRARHNGRVKWVVANVVLLSSCVFRLNPSYQWWQIQNIRSCIMWPRVASGSRLCLSSGVFNHCYNPSQFLLPGVSSHRPLTIKLSLMITHHHPSLSQSSCSLSGYSLANQRPHGANADQLEDRKLSPWLGHPVPQWESWRREKNDDTLICQCTFRPLSSQPGLIGLWANSKLNFNF